MFELTKAALEGLCSNQDAVKSLGYLALARHSVKMANESMIFLEELWSYD